MGSRELCCLIDLTQQVCRMLEYYFLVHLRESGICGAYASEDALQVQKRMHSIRWHYD